MSPYRNPGFFRSLFRGPWGTADELRGIAKKALPRAEAKRQAREKAVEKARAVEVNKAIKNTVKACRSRAKRGFFFQLFYLDNDQEVRERIVAELRDSGFGVEDLTLSSTDLFKHIKVYWSTPIE